ncbi:GTPase-activating protein skywalker-like [Pollicipes pollicipes]|uniref:GTPase-activating protein skywalker-like n=1 Tax=Pollicipes pollicipes TaxID=41117 RepID=UPI001884AA67|nr:GTPase-activating protein skywalker-like [Pollicipes pollicipes]
MPLMEDRSPAQVSALDGCAADQQSGMSENGSGVSRRRGSPSDSPGVGERGVDTPAAAAEAGPAGSAPDQAADVTGAQCKRHERPICAALVCQRSLSLGEEASEFVSAAEDLAFATVVPSSDEVAAAPKEQRSEATASPAKEQRSEATASPAKEQRLEATASPAKEQRSEATASPAKEQRSEPTASSSGERRSEPGVLSDPASALAQDSDAGDSPKPERNGMTATRTIWVVGSGEHLPVGDAGDTDDEGAPAASWGTVSSTFRAIRVFKRGVSKRLRRPSSPDRQASRSSLRRQRESHQAAGQGGGAGASGVDATMLEAAGGPVRPAVRAASFLADCGAYATPTKAATHTAQTAEQQLKDKKDMQMKEDLRTGCWPLDHPVRLHLWQGICEYHGAAMGQAEEYETTVRQLEGDYGPARAGQHQTPPFVHTFYANHYHLSEAGVWSADRVLAVLYYNNPTITYSPALYPVCCLLLHYMDEVDAYNALSMMLRNKKLGYLVQTRRDFEISWRIVIKLCRKHAKSSMHYLHQQTRHGENVEHVLADWLAWIFCFLPFPHAVRLMDCFLMEGEKVLYRAAMGLVLLLHKMASRQLGDWGAMLLENSVQDVMEIFCRKIPVTPDKLLKTLFNIRGFSRDSLSSSYTRVKAQIKAGGGRLNFPERRSVKAVTKEHSHPGLGMPSVMSQDELARSSSTIGVKEHSAKFPQLKDPNFELINFQELLRLWENLPARFALYTPLLLYTSDEHGFSLKTFYQKVATFEPTVLLLRSTEGAVFGAYCSTTWNTRNQMQEDGTRYTYFGTGETFLFTLRPQLKVYPWVGKVKQEQDPQLAGVSHSQQLFMAADNTMLTIGGGGGQAIWLDENLSRGKTDACDTFGNPPLTATGSFDVACMEAFGFAPA